MSTRNGRGRGISNAPAWMSQSNNNGGGDEEMRCSGGPTAGGGDDRNRRSSPDRRPPPTDDNGPNDDANNRSYYNDKRRDYDKERGRNNEEYSNRGRRGGGGAGNQRPPSNSGGGGQWEQRDERRRPPNRPNHRAPSRERDPRDNRSNNNRRPPNRNGIFFHSLAEERDWVSERTRKRRERRSLFDVEPTEEQLAMEELQKATLAASGAHPASFVRQEEQVREVRDSGRGGASSSSQPQQTRHARRLYIGHLPPDLDEEEVHGFFRDAIHTALGEGHSSRGDDPILSVYINKERRFAFVEFKTMDICTACLALDGVDVCNKGKVKIKRPNDYNPSLAPVASSATDSVINLFDISKLGIVSGTVPDSPNKIFIGGLPYHLNESQVMELLGAFGKVKAFHLVKADPTAITSKGYCFVEYSDGQSIRDVAVMGLNGMDMGGGKVLSARIAAVRGDPETTKDRRGGSSGMDIPGLGNVAPIVPSSGTAGGVVPPQLRYVDGVDVEALLDVAMGLAPLSSAAVVAPPPVPGMYYGPVPTGAGAANPGVPPPNTAVAPPTAAKPVMDIANAALEAAFGSSNNAPAPQINNAAAPPYEDAIQKTRILVLLNMVTDDDLATDEDYNGLMDEVKEECRKFGNLLSMKAPRPQDGFFPSSVKKIFLEYANTQDSGNAERELAGRQFGPAVVEVVYFSEDDYANGKLS